MSEQVIAPVETPDPFQGQSTTHEEFSKWRETGEVPERFKAKTEGDETPATEKKVETVDGKEPPKEAEQDKQDRDEKGKFKAKVEFSPEQQDVLNREIKKAKEKARREFEQQYAAKTSVSQATAADKKPEVAATAGEPKRPELPKLSEYKGTIEEFDKETAEYPAKLQAFLDAEREKKERVGSVQKRLLESEAKALKAHPDYREEFEALKADIQNNDEPQLPAHVLNAIAEQADDPHEVTYHLAKNREEFRRFAALSPDQTLREVLKLEFKLANHAATPAPVKKEPDPKPKPYEPVGARASSSAFDVNDEKLDADEWARQRNEQVAKRRR